MLILYFLVSMAHRGPAMLAGSYRCRRLSGRLRSLTPRKENFFQEGKNRAENKCGHTNSDNSGVNQIRLVELLCRLDHGAHAAIAVYNLSQNHVGPADVVKNAERRKDSRKRSAKHEPQHLTAFGAQRVRSFQQCVIDAVDFL